MSAQTTKRVIKSLTVVDAVDKTKALELSSSSSATTGTTMTVTATQTANRTLTLPDVTDTLVGLTASQTLQNKTIDGTDASGNNTVTNDATDVSYDNTTSGLAATDVKGALDELTSEKADAPGSSTDNAVARYDGSGGDLQDSSVLIDDSDNITGVNNLTVGGNLTVQGTTTTLSTSTLDVEDVNITINDGGNQASADNSAGLTVEMSDATNATLIYQDSLTSKFKIGESASEAEIATVSHSQTLTNKTLTSPEINTSLTLLNQATVVFRENSANGTEAVTVRAPSSLATSYTVTWPTNTPSADQIMVTDGSGNLTFQDQGAPIDGIGQGGVEAISSADTLDSNDGGKVFLADTTGGAFEITLFAASTDFKFTVIDVGGDFANNPVTIGLAATENIQGVSSDYLLESNYGSWTFIIDSNGDWWLI